MPKELKIEYCLPENLKPNGYNVNVVSPENEAKIDASIKRFGFFKPVLVRELPSGELEIVGGEHRWGSAKRTGMTRVPYTNLGKISDKVAREIGLVDNGRYGSDDSLRLAELLDDLKIDSMELAEFLPYTSTDFDNIFSSVSITLDDLDLDADDEKPSKPAEKPVQTSQILRFKVPIEDAGRIADLINKTIKVQKFKDGDELQNAGDALVHILNGVTGA